MSCKKFQILHNRLMSLLDRQLFLEVETDPNLNPIIKELEKKKEGCFHRVGSAESNLEKIESEIKAEQEKLVSYSDELQEIKPSIVAVLSELQTLLTPPEFDYTSQIALEIFGSHDTN